MSSVIDALAVGLKWAVDWFFDRLTGKPLAVVFAIGLAGIAFALVVAS